MSSRMGKIGYFSNLFPKTGSQPMRKGTERFQHDLRRICDRPECTTIESGIKKFGKCKRCMKIAYCSKECQKLHWSNHKMLCNKSNITKQCQLTKGFLEN